MSLIGFRPLFFFSSLSSSSLSLRRLSSSVRMAKEAQEFRFGPYKINQSEVFYSTSLSYAMVNLRPLLPVKRYVDLTNEEVSDLWISAKKIGAKMEQFHKASSLTLTIQDGPQAGQTVPHVHIHIIPRKSGDFENNDEIYDAIDAKEKELNEKLNLDIERKDRTSEEMAQEAETYRALFL
ncbi:hypothetical protein LUZ60_015470 [Juncus effusus]|nr:hypothetical protein LUZ60_015470 [Juncus effusus]